MNPKVLDRALTAFRFLSAYHKHEVSGIERVPRQGPAIIIINHSLATYDAFLLAGAIYQHTGRICRALGDKRIFQTPLLSSCARGLGMVQGSPTAGEKLLKEGHLVIISPGGMRESLRPTKEKYKILWHDRQGFARLAIESQAPIILAACPAADRIFSVYDNPLTSFVYRRFKMPFPLARGVGATLFPKPIPLKHHLSEPIQPPSIHGKINGEVPSFHKLVFEQMEKLMVSALPENEQL